MQTYFEIYTRSAEAYSTKNFISLPTRFKELNLLSQYIYDFSMLFFEKPFIFHDY